MIAQTLDAIVQFLGGHPILALLIVFAVSLGEALLIVGLVMPSTVILVGAGTMIGLGRLPFLPVFVATTLGAVAGDAISFWFGHHWKAGIRGIWPFSRVVFLIDRGERFFERHGGKSVFVARFLPGVKSAVPTVAGMVGMSPTRFAIVNVLSALAWAAAHLVPGVLVGRGIRVTQTTNPRLIVLLFMVAALLVAAWYVTRLAYQVLLPRAERVRFALADRLAGSGHAAARRAARLLADEDGMLRAYLYAALALLALFLFSLILGRLLLDPEMARSDAAISGYVQILRTEAFTRAMVAVTMIGDSAVLLPVAVAIVAMLLGWRHRKTALSAAVAMLAATAFVPLVKSVLQRARPSETLYGPDSFSFPSGHSALATVVLGFAALVIAHTLPERFHRAVYLVAALMIALVGFSRIYLLAHWPSDVLAGMLFGLALVFAMAILLHGRRLRIPARASAALAAVVLLLVYPLHLRSDFGASLARYEAAPGVVTLGQAEWLATGWRQLPEARVLLDGDYGEPMLLQTDRPLDAVVARLAATGWRRSESSQLDDILGVLLPSRAPLADRPPLPMTHVGRAAMATLTRVSEAAPGRMEVLRIWASGQAIEAGAVERPLLLVSVTREGLLPLAFGFGHVASEAPDAGDAARIAEKMAGSLGGTASRPAAGLPILVPE
ncbi:bifunctional DedA family/phosphatase PAP2 family protein [Amaricoccus sp.]|uniref:bifunctional DedA family/phosphatase PAP2 family protein n=1 Tax=Amaricoccus sp. TaxID=1872485 RepID=UPI001D5FFFAC|nr:bifunctional DedA family/phosphatase PAP2 family protein [Amaricoccus sp.]MCB1401802.1 bifunctional DedA family/phosphatase PAP2 family protein [Paracoccaceae bacterium]MCC0066996.1 bifunctional DedA family/phosphatase PAP2 family protein [Rhodovulum sp.]HRW16566.1 bifunctional DedA family/phosphatase PAP2 family protein [Amaricoccus sp.]